MYCNKQWADFAAACAAVTTATSSAAAAELRQMQKDLERSRTRDKNFRAHVKALKDTHKASFKRTNILENDVLFRSLLLLLYCCFTAALLMLYSCFTHA